MLLISKCYHKAVAVSHNMQDVLTNEYGFRNDDVKVIHNGIETNLNYFRPEKKGYFVVGSCGRLFAVKDYPFMVEIAKILKKKTNIINFTLAGEGPERKLITNRIKSYNLTNSFKLIGHIDNTSKFFQNLQLYLNTSIHEGIPLSVLEAMAHGIPIIAPDVGGLHEVVINGEHGFLIDQRDPEIFAEKILFLFKNSQLRAKMSLAARHRVRKLFSMESMAKKYHKIYVDVTSNKYQ